MSESTAEAGTGWRANVTAALEGHHPRLGRAVPFFLQAVIVFSLVSIAVESIPDLPASMGDLLNVLEIVTVALFTIEYVLRLVVADRPLRYVFSFFGLVDLIAILPFYLALGADYRVLRALRLIRLLWLLKIVRYTHAVENLSKAVRSVREELIVFAIIALLVIYICGVGIYIFEHDAQPDRYRSVFDGLWWAAVTLTTVGYGDIYPVTAGGRLFTTLILFVGLGVIAVPTGLVSSAFGAVRRQTREKDGHDETG